MAKRNKSPVLVTVVYGVFEETNAKGKVKKTPVAGILTEEMAEDKIFKKWLKSYKEELELAEDISEQALEDASIELKEITIDENGEVDIDDVDQDTVDEIASLAAGDDDAAGEPEKPAATTRRAKASKEDDDAKPTTRRAKGSAKDEPVAKEEIDRTDAPEGALTVGEGKRKKFIMLHCTDGIKRFVIEKDEDRKGNIVSVTAQRGGSSKGKRLELTVENIEVVSETLLVQVKRASEDPAELEF